jgi:hypothetical protein
MEFTDTYPTTPDASISTQDRQSAQADTLRRLAYGPVDTSTYASPATAPKPSPSAPTKKPESISLAAFMGGRATGPRLNKHTPQQDAHDPTQFEQRTHITAPHPVFGRGGVAMLGLARDSSSGPTPGSSSASGAYGRDSTRSTELSSPGNNKPYSSASTTSYEKSHHQFTPASKRENGATTRERTISSPGQSFEKNVASTRFKGTQGDYVTRPTPQPSRPEAQPHSQGHLALTGLTRTSPAPTSTVSSRPHFNAAHSFVGYQSLPATPNRTKTPPAPSSSLSHRKSQPSIDVISPPAPSYPLPHRKSQPSINAASVMYEQRIPTNRTKTPPAPEPPAPSRSSAKRRQSLPSSSFTTPPRNSSVITSSLARPILPDPKPSPQGPQLVHVSSSPSPAFLRPLAQKDLTPSLSRLQGRGFVQNMVKVSTQLEAGASFASSDSPPSSTGKKKASVVDRWQQLEASTTTRVTPPPVSPKPSPLRKSRTVDSSSPRTADDGRRSTLMKPSDPRKSYEDLFYSTTSRPDPFIASDDRYRSTAMKASDSRTSYEGLSYSSPKSQVDSSAAADDKYRSSPADPRKSHEDLSYSSTQSRTDSVRPNGRRTPKRHADPDIPTVKTEAHAIIESSSLAVKPSHGHRTPKRQVSPDNRYTKSEASVDYSGASRSSNGNGQPISSSDSQSKASADSASSDDRRTARRKSISQPNITPSDVTTTLGSSQTLFSYIKPTKTGDDPLTLQRPPSAPPPVEVDELGFRPHSAAGSHRRVAASRLSDSQPSESPGPSGKPLSHVRSFW